MDNFIRDAVPKPLLGELFEKSSPKTPQKLLILGKNDDSASDKIIPRLKFMGIHSLSLVCKIMFIYQRFFI